MKNATLRVCTHTWVTSRWLGIIPRGVYIRAGQFTLVGHRSSCEFDDLVVGESSGSAQVGQFVAKGRARWLSWLRDVTVGGWPACGEAQRAWVAVSAREAIENEESARERGRERMRGLRGVGAHRQGTLTLGQALVAVAWSLEAGQRRAGGRERERG